MTLTRWKLLSGTFGLAVCGLAALAEPACQKSKQTTDVVAQSNCAVPPPAPLSIPLPMPSPLPEVAALLPMVIPMPLPVEAAPAPRLAVTVPSEAPPVTMALPVIDVPVAAVAKTVSAAALAQFVNDAAKSGEVLAQPMPAITLPQVVTLPAVVPVLKTAPSVQTTGYTAPGLTAEKKFKVLLQFGDTLPKFEIRDGEETLLKVVADKVDVKSPAERSELWATLKATGQVKFVTPGGEGVCDELSVMPGSGEVVASGSVKFTTSWGKVETAVTSERMTFKLGKGPALTHAPAPTPVGANTKEVKQIFFFGNGYIPGQ